MPPLRVLLLLTTLLLPASAMAGAIHGTLSPKATKSAAAKKGRQSVVDAVIYIEQLPNAVERKLNSRGFWFFRKPAPPRVRALIQKDRRFDPYVLATAVGDRVAFDNMDRVYHSPFSVSAAKRFDLNRRPPGHRDTLTLDQPGVINLHCDIHPDMGGYIVVTPNHAFTFPDEQGRYRLPALPPGTYEVHVFHPRWGELRRDVQIVRGSDTLLDLAY